MNCNHLKLNQSKTNFIEFSSSRSVDNCIISRITLIACTSDVLVPSTTVKNLGVIFDGNLLFDKHVNKIVSVCYNNIRNLGRIGSKLSIPLKTQLVHSMILSHLDYCRDRPLAQLQSARYQCRRSEVRFPGRSNRHSVANDSPSLRRFFGAV